MDCYATCDQEELVIGNGVIERRFSFDGGHLAATAVIDRRTGRAWVMGDAPASAVFPGHAGPGADATFEATSLPEDAIRPARLVATVTYRLGTLEVRRKLEIVRGVPAVRSTMFLRGTVDTPWSADRPHATRQGNIEDIKQVGYESGPTPLIESLPLGVRHLECEAIQFFDATDRRNNLVQTQRIVPFTYPSEWRGNVLTVCDTLKKDRLWLLKEGPCSDVQLADGGFDFRLRTGRIEVAGLGVNAQDITPQRWVPCYGCVVGVGGRDERETLDALRTYQMTQRRMLPGRDHMVMLNTWGDRGQDSRINHEFALRELDLAARLGISHFQLDDGWQAGQSSNSATPGGSLADIWRRDDYWHVHPARFPQGLSPIVERGRELGVELCLWFNPAKEDSYANWRRDAHAMIDLYREYGIRTFKIDGVKLPDKSSEIHLRAMFDEVLAATDGQAVFNMDATSGQRMGYHFFAEYGNVFLENRYTDWGNYHPHWTLRNLWMLSRYAPAQRLQVEFLNPARNAAAYPADDPLAPGYVPLEYAFAITMMAQPLAWMEAGHLSDEQMNRLGPLVKAYRQHQEAIHRGHIHPILEEPNGTAWTGLVSINREGGYLAIYRELHTTDTWRGHIPFLPDQVSRVQRILGEGDCRPPVSTEGDSGIWHFRQPRPLTFGLYQFNF